jgi:endonuclease III
VRGSKGLLQDHDLDDSSVTDLKVKVKRVTRLLERNYGVPRRGMKRDPLDTLIETILSQNTNDRNRDQAYRALRRRFPRWADVLRSDLREIIQAIRPGGLARQKAGRIREILRWIQDRFGGLDLGVLKGMDSESIKKIFGNLKGVGPKTLHCLLLFGLGREAFPVDTHILRIGKRLGFIPEKMNAEKAHPRMAALVPKGQSLSLHVNLIQFGRLCCRANHPRCSDCFLTKECLRLSQTL